ncbi:hypothetical protein EC957_011150 [Mortierella hygrophila]|uniref:Uncharacterized protein n=1 Tax=Mortierella hygrophila TaxID=979708 RepID=A0A9P6F9U0_9FUNG|nr:hypothetical protein EC957_011150 [Mortierella hygrophila]
MGPTDLGELLKDTGMKEANLDDGFPALASPWLEVFERVGDVEDELDGFEDTFFGPIAGETSCPRFTYSQASHSGTVIKCFINKPGAKLSCSPSGRAVYSFKVMIDCILPRLDLKRLQSIIGKGITNHSEGLESTCKEMLLGPHDVEVPVFDSFTGFEGSEMGAKGALGALLC